MAAPQVVSDGCPYCGGRMRVTEMACGHCDVAVRAAFPMTRLSRVPVEHQRFIEMFILCGGNLKELAQQVGVSYPTIRSRLDRVIEVLRAEIAKSRAAGKPAHPVDGSGDDPDDVARMMKDI